MTNNEYAKSAEFVSLCEKAGVKPSKRQASKFRLGNGAAFGVLVAKARKAHKARPVPERLVNAVATFAQRLAA